MCFQFLQSVVHGVQWYVFCFGYTDKMPIIIIFDPSGSCVIFARSIFIIFCLHTQKIVIFAFIHCNIYSYFAAFYETNVTHDIQIMNLVSFVEISYKMHKRHICKPSDQKILYSIKVKSKKAFFIFDGDDVVVYVAIFS